MSERYLYAISNIFCLTAVLFRNIILFLIPFFHLACFVSDTEDNPWMTVDLQEETAISTVVIYSPDTEGEVERLLLKALSHMPTFAEVALESAL